MKLSLGEGDGGFVLHSANGEREPGSKIEPIVKTTAYQSLACLIRLSLFMLYRDISMSSISQMKFNQSELSKASQSLNRC